MEELQKYYVIKLEDNYVVIISYGGYQDLINQGFDIYGCFDKKNDAHNYADYRNEKITNSEFRKLIEDETEETYD